MTSNVVVNAVHLFLLIRKCLICTNQLLSRDSIAWKFSFSNHSKEFVEQRLGKHRAGFFIIFPARMLRILLYFVISKLNSTDGFLFTVTRASYLPFASHRLLPKCVVSNPLPATCIRHTGNVIQLPFVGDSSR